MFNIFKFYSLAAFLFFTNISLALPVAGNIPPPVNSVVQPVTGGSSGVTTSVASPSSISPTNVTGVVNTISSLSNPTIIPPSYQSGANQFFGVTNSLVGSTIPTPIRQQVIVVKLETVRIINGEEVVALTFGTDPLISFSVPAQTFNKNKMGNGRAVSQMNPQQASKVFDDIINTQGIPQVKSVAMKQGELILSSESQSRQVAQVRVDRVARVNRNVEDGVIVQDTGVAAGIIGEGTGINNPTFEDVPANQFLALARTGAGAGVIGEGTGLKNPTNHQSPTGNESNTLEVIDTTAGVGVRGAETRDFLQETGSEVATTSRELTSDIVIAASDTGGNVKPLSPLQGTRVNTLGVEAGINNSPEEPAAVTYENQSLGEELNSVASRNNIGVGIGVIDNATGINNPPSSPPSNSLVAVEMLGLGVGVLGDGTGINNDGSSNSSEAKLVSVQNTGVGVGVLGTSTGIDNTGTDSNENSSSQSLVSASNTGVGVGALGTGTGIENSNNSERGSVVAIENTGIGVGAAGEGTGINNSSDSRTNNDNAGGSDQGSLLTVDNTGVGVGVIGEGTGINNQASGGNTTSDGNSQSLILIKNTGIGVGVGGSGTGISSASTGENNTTPQPANNGPTILVADTGVGVGVLGTGVGINNALENGGGNPGSSDPNSPNPNSPSNSNNGGDSRFLTNNNPVQTAPNQLIQDQNRVISANDFMLALRVAQVENSMNQCPNKSTLTKYAMSNMYTTPFSIGKGCQILGVDEDTGIFLVWCGSGSGKCS